MKNKIKNLKILITGGAGFIGSYVAKRLMDLGCGVIIVDNFNPYYNPKLKEARISQFLRGYKFKLYRIDVFDFLNLKKIFQENKIDIICHQAAQAGVRYSLTNPFVYEQSNVRGTLNLLELAKEFKVKSFIFASSSSVYGGNKKLPFSEDDRTDNPISLYAATKKSVELLARCYHNLYKIPCAGIRYFSVYGPWGRPDMALFKFTKAILSNQSIEVYNFGKMKRNFTYIDDIVGGTIAIMEKNYSFEIFNLGGSEVIELNYYIELIEKLLGKKAKKKFLPLQPGDAPETFADTSKVKRLLGWSPKVSIKEGLEKFVKWFKENEKFLRSL